MTGAAMGIGQGIAISLAEGAIVSCFDIVRLPGESAETSWTVGDIRSSPDVDDFMASTHRHFSHVDVLVNCAGAVSRDAVDAITDDDWEMVLDVNLRTPMHTCGVEGHEQPVARWLQHQGRVSGRDQSRTSDIPLQCCESGRTAVYEISCSGVRAARSGQLDLFGINRNGHGARSLTEYAQQSSLTYQEAIVQRRSVIPLQCFQSPKNLAGGVLVQASSAVTEITGPNLDVRGGELIPR